jgi:hypothetical protein
MLTELLYNSSSRGAAGETRGGQAPPQPGFTVVLTGTQGDRIAEGFLALHPDDPPMSDVYIVMENPPSDCQEMPSCQNLNIRNISIEWEAGAGGDTDALGNPAAARVAAPAWTWKVATLSQQCKPQLLVHTPDHLEFLWSTGTKPTGEAHHVDEL